MKVSEILSEGFSDFTVGGSDNAADAHAAVKDALEKAEKNIRQNKMLPDAAVKLMLCREAIKELKKALKEKGNAYNTHGTLNVAMILDEHFHQFRKFGEWQEFAVSVAETLETEVKDRNFNDNYTAAMRKLVPKLKKLGK